MPGSAPRAGRALVNEADPGVRALLADPALAGADTYGGGTQPGAGGRRRRRQPCVLVGGVPALGLARSRLPGPHNRANVAAAVAVLDALGVNVVGERGRLEDALAGFAPLPHRLEPVATVAGVTFVDDSLATSAQAAVAACEAYAGRPLTLLAGGLDRGIDYEPLVRYLTARVGEGLVAVVAMGPAGARLAAALREAEVEQGVPAERGVPSRRSAVPTRAVSRWNARTTSRTPCGSPQS